MKKFRKVIIVLLLYPFTAFPQQQVWKYTDDRFKFEWNLNTDNANLILQSNNSVIWSGSLLPAFAIKSKPFFIKPIVELDNSLIGKDSLHLKLGFGSFGSGSLDVTLKPWGINFTKFSVRWSGEIPSIVNMYLGSTAQTPEQLAAHMQEEKDFYPDWSAFGYCIPGAKEGPVQSYFRSWDFGRSDIPLGSFGPSMGSPYGAAFPRPVLFASMGNTGGWITLGAGSLPDAAMTLLIRSGRACLQYQYREDLWGAGKSSDRSWDNLLRITFGDNAWLSMQSYIRSFPNEKPVNTAHQKAIWNTWGNWKMNEYAIPPIIDFARKTGAEMMVLDDPWQSSQGSSLPDLKKFPDFFKDIDSIHQRGMEHGIWKSLVWVDDPAAEGLTKEDLMVDVSGIPCKSNWNFDPFQSGHFQLDLSSPNARRFLNERVTSIMKTIKPKLIKLDFGYGISDASISVPRNPEIRGERYCYTLAKAIADAARNIDPDVTILYYGISPLFQSVVDMVSLDDQGDLWYNQSSGHDQWSIWASLLSQQHMALNGSSGYDWDTDDETLLNTAILGSPGSVLPDHLDKKEVPDEYINRRYALNSWYRKSIQWDPVWFNSDIGGMITPMQLNCWGRSETIAGKPALTALALRERNKKILDKGMLKGFEWSGRWALIAQDSNDICMSGNLALIPFDNNSFIQFPLKNKPAEVRKVSYVTSENFKQWTWKNGSITIHLPPGSLSSTAGVLILTSK